MSFQRLEKFLLQMPKTVTLALESMRELDVIIEEFFVGVHGLEIGILFYVVEGVVTAQIGVFLGQGWDLDHSLFFCGVCPL